MDAHVVSTEEEVYTKTLKLALAISIIRSKPLNLTSKQYATQVANKLKSSESTWKTKVKQLQQELDESKNEIVLLKMKNESISGNILHDEKKSNEKDKKAHPTSAPYSKNRFFLSVINIQHWSAILKTNHSIFPTIKSNILKTFDDFKFSITNIKEHEIHLLMPTIKLVIEMLKQDKFSSDTGILESCSRIIENMLACILTAAFHQESLIEDIAHIIVLLSSTCLLIRDVITEKLSLLIQGFTKLLMETTDIISLDVLKYERMYYICDTLLTIVDSTFDRWPSKNRGTCCELIESDLFSISDRFLLYSHSVWFIASTMAEFQLQHKV